VRLRVQGRTFGGVWSRVDGEGEIFTGGNEENEGLWWRPAVAGLCVGEGGNLAVGRVGDFAGAVDGEGFGFFEGGDGLVDFGGVDFLDAVANVGAQFGFAGRAGFGAFGEGFGDAGGVVGGGRDGAGLFGRGGRSGGELDFREGFPPGGGDLVGLKVFDEGVEVLVLGNDVEGSRGIAGDLDADVLGDEEIDSVAALSDGFQEMNVGEFEEAFLEGRREFFGLGAEGEDNTRCGIGGGSEVDVAGVLVIDVDVVGGGH